MQLFLSQSLIADDSVWTIPPGYERVGGPQLYRPIHQVPFQSTIARRVDPNSLVPDLSVRQGVPNFGEPRLAPNDMNVPSFAARPEARLGLPTDCVPSSVSPPSYSYYVVIFGSARRFPHRPSPHVFGSFIRVQHAPGYLPAKYDIVTLSWYPDRDKVAFIDRAERGLVRNLIDSLERCVQLDSRIVAYGPYEISEDLFYAADAHLDLLESGTVRWQACDYIGRRRQTVFNCVHAVTDADVSRGYVMTYMKSGIRAANATIEHFRPLFLSEQVHDDIWEGLDINHFDIERRPLPESRSVIDRIKSAVGKLVPARLRRNKDREEWDGQGYTLSDQLESASEPSAIALDHLDTHETNPPGWTSGGQNLVLPEPPPIEMKPVPTHTSKKQSPGDHRDRDSDPNRDPRAGSSKNGMKPFSPAQRKRLGPPLQ